MRNSSPDDIRERTDRGQATRARNSKERVARAQANLQVGRRSGLSSPTDGKNTELEIRIPSVADYREMERRHRRATWLRTHYPQLSARNTYHVVEMASSSETLQVTLCEVVVRIGWVQFLLTIGCITTNDFIELALVRRNMERVIIEAMIESRKIE